MVLYPTVALTDNCSTDIYVLYLGLVEKNELRIQLILSLRVIVVSVF